MIVYGPSKTHTTTSIFMKKKKKQNLRRKTIRRRKKTVINTNEFTKEINTNMMVFEEKKMIIMDG